MAEIRFENLKKRFGDSVVVKDLNLTIQEKEFFTFVGPSGCGKSTILNILAGLEDATEGTIYFDGIPVNDMPSRERDVAMVFQSYALYPHMTVYENIAFPLRIRKTPQRELGDDVRKTAGLLGLEGFLDRKPKELSGGQRQRVALGRAIIRRPRVFLMDEPLSNLDARLRIEMRAEIKNLHRRLGITTVYVTHDQEEAMALSDRIAILKEGRIMQCAHPVELYEKPSNIFAASFIGSPPMNFINGELFRDTPSLQPLLQRFNINDITVGIRPCDIDVVLDDRDSVTEAEVILLEPVGSDTWVDMIWNGAKIKGRTDFSDRIVAGAKVFLKISLHKLHLFSKATGERLL